MGRVVHFEIHASDPERAATFYRTTMGWEINKWGEAPYWLVKTGGADGARGVDGGILPRRGPAPAADAPVHGYVNTIDVDDLDAALAKVSQAGGTLALPRMPVPGIGWLAYCKDTEGNIFGMMQADPAAK